MDVAVRTAVMGFIVDNFLFGDADRAPRDEESLMEGGIIDSTGVLELIEFLESSFGIEVPETETVPENLDSVVNLCRYVMRKRSDLPAAV